MSSARRSTSTFRSGSLRRTAIAQAITALSGGLLFGALLSACGGGDDGTPAPTPAAVLTAASISGTAATGAALVGGVVVITGSTGASACEEASIVTSATGSYTCTLNATATAPLFIVVTDPSGNNNPLVAVSTTLPAAGTSATLNATPLTTAIAGQLAADGNPLTLVASKTVDAAALTAVTTNVIAQLATVLASVNAPAGYNPFTTPIVAATPTALGNAADTVLAVVKLTTDPATGKAAVSTIDSPTPVTLATAAVVGTALVAPTTDTASLAAGLQVATAAFQNCFAVPVAQRVTTADATVAASLGGPTVTAFGTACADLAASTTNAAGKAYLHNGYSAGQDFYTLLNQTTMTGAKFSVAEVLATYPASPTNPARAVLNFRYLDANGNPGSFITLAQDLAGTSTATHASTWWLTGNQQPVDIVFQPIMRRIEELNAAATVPSRFQSGLQILINAVGPGSVTAAGTLSYARVTGPGLSPAGVVFTAPVAAEVGQRWMDIANRTGTIPPTTRCNSSTVPTYNCPIFWMTRTVGVTGADATTLTTNPVAVTYLQTATLAAAAIKGAAYRFELFYGASVTPFYNYTKTLLVDVTPATQGIALKWNTLGPQGQGFLDVANASLNGVLNTVTIDWNQVPGSEQVGSASVTVDTIGSYGTSQPVPKGATSLVYIATPPVPAMSPTGIRALLLNYRMLNATYRSSVFTFN